MKSPPRAGNIVRLTVVHGLSLAGGFLASVLGARLLGADGMGTVGVVLTISFLAAILLGGGLGMGTIYFLNRRPEDRPMAVGRLLVLGALLIGLDLVVTAAVGIAVGAAAPELRDAMLVAAPLSASLLAIEITGSVLLGLGEERAFIRVHLAEVVIGLVATATWLIFVGATPAGFLAATALGYGLAAGIALVLVARRVGPIRLGWSSTYSREVFAYGVRAQLGNTIQFVNLRLDLVLVSALAGLTAAGLYYVASRVAEALLVGAQSTAALLFPRVAAQDDREATKSTEELVRRVIIVVGAGALAVIVVGESAIRLVFGDAFGGAAAAASIVAIAMVPTGVHRLLAGDLRGRGRPGLGSASSLVALAATVILDLALIPPFGIVGAAVASLVAYSVAALVVIVLFVRTTGAPARLLVPRWGDVVALARAGTRIR